MLDGLFTLGSELMADGQSVTFWTVLGGAVVAGRTGLYFFDKKQAEQKEQFARLRAEQESAYQAWRRRSKVYTRNRNEQELSQ